jgi:hypothetical protein
MMRRQSRRRRVLGQELAIVASSCELLQSCSSLYAPRGVKLEPPRAPPNPPPPRPRGAPRKDMLYVVVCRGVKAQLLELKKS